MVKLPYVQTNVFIDEHYTFSGNQLATFYDKNVNINLYDVQMKGLDREINLS